MSKRYPCTDCERVANPRDCENKLCKDWRTWFICTWEAMRAYVASFNDKKEDESDER